MPAQVVLFSAYSSVNPKPKQVYCDSNFLIRLLFYHDNANNPGVLAPKDIDCYNFYNQLTTNGSELITSVYGFSELIHFYFFNYGTDGMYQAVKSFMTQNRINLPNTSVHDRYKYFIKNYPADFNAAFSRIRHRIHKADTFLNQLGVKVLYPLPSPDLSNISRSIVDYASILMDAFPKLESNDAMHLSIADYLNIEHIVSLDEAYKDVDSFTIYARN